MESNLAQGKTENEYILFHVSGNCLWFSSLFGTEKNAFANSVGAYYVPETLLLCSSKDTAFDIAAVTRVLLGWDCGSLQSFFRTHPVPSGVKLET